MHIAHGGLCIASLPMSSYSEDQIYHYVHLGIVIAHPFLQGTIDSTVVSQQLINAPLV